MVSKAVSINLPLFCVMTIIITKRYIMNFMFFHLLMTMVDLTFLLGLNFIEFYGFLWDCEYKFTSFKSDCEIYFDYLTALAFLLFKEKESQW